MEEIQVTDQEIDINSTERESKIMNDDKRTTKHK